MGCGASKRAVHPRTGRSADADPGKRAAPPAEWEAEMRHAMGKGGEFRNLPPDLSANDLQSVQSSVNAQASEKRVIHPSQPSNIYSMSVIMEASREGSFCWSSFDVEEQRRVGGHTPSMSGSVNRKGFGGGASPLRRTGSAGVSTGRRDSKGGGPLMDHAARMNASQPAEPRSPLQVAVRGPSPEVSLDHLNNA
uniref:Uncharacterized protein n=1 Tax=Hemiselmis andersenii TaxID=464988 RepID=A0A6U4T8B4_HEMAN|mmetsp:Transcript_16729/g.38622  ORF Transcript_16729/g.38622 Transcript_16729/m.38622 type:complete len:194 (-) Transcript_16729:385-966(-)